MPMSKIIMSEFDLAFAPLPNESHIILDDQPPPTELTTSALGLVFDGSRLLLPKLTQRGWDIPGGHIEAGELPEESFRREVREETGAILSVVCPLGYQKIVIHGPKPAGYKYPYPESYQAFYWGLVERLGEFLPDDEVSERQLFAPDEAVKIPWVRKFEPLYRAALTCAAGAGGVSP